MMHRSIAAVFLGSSRWLRYQMTPLWGITHLPRHFNATGPPARIAAIGRVFSDAGAGAAFSRSPFPVAPIRALTDRTEDWADQHRAGIHHPHRRLIVSAHRPASTSPPRASAMRLLTVSALPSMQWA